MTHGQVRSLLRYVCQVIGPPDGGAETDSQLLERFVTHQDEAAFRALVQRYGPMVLGVCRRILGHAQDAEDAFQVTFLVLVRKARSIAHGDRLSHWLYGVAVRSASKLKVREARRRRHECRAVAPSSTATGPTGLEPDLRPVLDQEIQQLPGKYRTPFLLCYLEGKTNREAAAELGCPPGTVSSRLAWARQRLRTRLAQRGITLSAALAGAGVSQAAPAMVPAGLEATTVQLATAFAGGKLAAAGEASLRVAALTQGVLKAMFWARWKSIAVVSLLAMSLVGSGAGVLAHRTLLAGETKGSFPASAEADSPNLEKLRQEVIRLQRDLQKVQEEAALLRAKLESAENAAEPVFFRGKPAGFWIKALKDRDPAYRVDAVIALRAIAEVDRSVIPMLIASLKDKGDSDQHYVGQRAAEALGNLGAAALPALRDAMKDPDRETRRLVAEALGTVGKEAVPALTNALRDADPGVVATVVYSLVRIGHRHEAAIRAVQTAAKNKDARQRQQIIKALSNRIVDFGNAGAVCRIFVEALNDPEADVRHLAIAGLNYYSRIGGTHIKDSVLPALVNILKDPKTEKSLRKEVFELLNRLDPATAKAAVGFGDP
jgi:RNA polymerase sigma factor (sigma-70 family)